MFHRVACICQGSKPFYATNIFARISNLVMSTSQAHTLELQALTPRRRGRLAERAEYLRCGENICLAVVRCLVIAHIIRQSSSADAGDENHTLQNVSDIGSEHVVLSFNMEDIQDMIANVVAGADGHDPIADLGDFDGLTPGASSSHGPNATVAQRPRRRKWRGGSFQSHGMRGTEPPEDGAARFWRAWPSVALWIREQRPYVTAASFADGMVLRRVLERWFDVAVPPFQVGDAVEPSDHGSETSDQNDEEHQLARQFDELCRQCSEPTDGQMRCHWCGRSLCANCYHRDMDRRVRCVPCMWRGRGRGFGD
jgi:hypothetical protein